MIDIVYKTAEKVFIPLTVGGGIESVNDIRSLLKAGADKISINTAAILNDRLVKESSERFGSQCIVAAVDAKELKMTGLFFSWGTKNTGINVLKC